MRVRLVGRGRAGGSLAIALERAGWDVAGSLGHDDDPTGAALGVDLVLVAVPDRAVASVAAAIEPVEATVVAHVAGSLGLEVLAPHVRRGAVHPLVSLPSAELGAQRLVGAWFGIAGDPLVAEVVRSLDGRSFPVADDQRATYHAAASVASNHLVALMGQVERIAASVGVPLEAYLDLARGTLDNVAALGPAAALTGPAARGDTATIEAHLAAIARDERPAYEALMAAAVRLAGLAQG